jgi:RHS repeat-associated protein
LQVFHDALGRPIGVVEGVRTRVFVPDGGNAIESYDNGVLSAVYVREGRDQLCFFAAAGQDQYVFRDVLESTRLTTDSKAAAIGVFRYDPFGELVSGVPAIPFLYSGKYRYASIGWDEYRRRQYIPSLGRFAQPDPAGFIDGPNLYSFVGNNPLSARDPNGTQRQEVPAAATDDKSGNGNTTPILGVVSLKPFDVVQWRKDVDEALQGTATPAYKVARDLAGAEGQRQREYLDDLRQEALVEQELPGVVAAITPVYGSAKSSYIHFSHGNYGRGVLLGAMAISDIALVKSLAVGSGKLLLKGAALLMSEADRNAPKLLLAGRGAGAGGASAVAADSTVLKRATDLGVVPGERTAPYFNAAWGKMSPTFLRGRSYAQAVNEYVSGLDASATTITQTAGGAFASSMGVTDAALWQTLSADYAVEAGLLGRAEVVLGGVASKSSVWTATERPILEFFGVSFKVHLRVLP